MLVPTSLSGLAQKPSSVLLNLSDAKLGFNVNNMKGTHWDLGRLVRPMLNPDDSKVPADDLLFAVCEETGFARQLEREPLRKAYAHFVTNFDTLGLREFPKKLFLSSLRSRICVELGRLLEVGRSFSDLKQVAPVFFSTDPKAVSMLDDKQLAELAVLDAQLKNVLRISKHVACDLYCLGTNAQIRRTFYFKPGTLETDIAPLRLPAVELDREVPLALRSSRKQSCKFVGSGERFDGSLRPGDTICECWPFGGFFRCVNRHGAPFYLPGLAKDDLASSFVYVDDGTVWNQDDAAPLWEVDRKLHWISPADFSDVGIKSDADAQNWLLKTLSSSDSLAMTKLYRRDLTVVGRLLRFFGRYFNELSIPPAGLSPKDKDEVLELYEAALSGETLDPLETVSRTGCTLASKPSPTPTDLCLEHCISP